MENAMKLINDKCGSGTIMHFGNDQHEERYY